MNKVTYYKFKVTNKEANETKLFYHYNELKDYCGVPRSTLYRIFNGETPNRWCKQYTFEKVKLPREVISRIEYSL